MVPMSEIAGPKSFGRVAEDKTVYVRTAEGERAVGQVPDVSDDEALEFYVRRFRALELEVDLLTSRVRSGALAPDAARKAVGTLRESVAEASAVGDLAALLAKLDELSPVLAAHAEERRQQRAQQIEETRVAKEAMVTEAEKIAAGNDWRGGVNRFRSLLDQWKALPRIDRPTDDALWHRFSTARTAYTKRRKQQFAQQATERESARSLKERIIAEAEPLATSTDWGPTSGAFRDLMSRWKAAGPAPRDIDDKLWKRFRALQDQFFDARTASQAEQDAEFGVNQSAKEALLAEYEPQILETSDLDTAKRAYRDLLERWAEIGKVPRDAIRPLDQRLRALEQKVRAAEDEQWRRTDPQARERAEETAGKLRSQIAELETKAAKAEARSDRKAADQARQAIATYQSWLEQAEKAVSDFSG